MTDASYSPRRRTGVVLCGTGTAGAYQAGVLRALTDAGVKVDVLAAHGAGVMTALCGAVDGGARLWDAAGPWTDARLRAAYRWRRSLRVGAAGLAVAVLLLLFPLLVLVFAAGVYAASVLTALGGLPDLSARLVGVYAESIAFLFSPPVLPTVIPRLVVLALVVVAAVVVLAATRAMRRDRTRRRLRGGFWWWLLGSPVDPEEPAATLLETVWRLVRGASNEPRPEIAEIGRRYVDVLADNFGQPGFRELVVAVHDLDARRDLVGAVLPAASRGVFEARRRAGVPREAETVDFTGPLRELTVDFLLGALRLPVATAPHAVTFPSDSYWRGETHRLCDRPELAQRLLDELAVIGVEQVVLVSPAAPAAVPHGLRTRPGSLRSRIGDFVRSVETAAFEDALASAADRFPGVFVVRPDHNPIGPFDFAGVRDEASDRHRTVAELMQQGHEDAYRQFIEPAVASGERLEAI